MLSLMILSHLALALQNGFRGPGPHVFLIFGDANRFLHFLFPILSSRARLSDLRKSCVSVPTGSPSCWGPVQLMSYPTCPERFFLLFHLSHLRPHLLVVSAESVFCPGASFIFFSFSICSGSSSFCHRALCLPMFTVFCDSVTESQRHICLFKLLCGLSLGVEVASPIESPSLFRWVKLWSRGPSWQRMMAVLHTEGYFLASLPLYMRCYQLPQL